jgi:hypothetical protein
MFETPDLSKEFNPVPKPQKKEKKSPQPIKQLGKKGRDNVDNVAERKKEFEKAGITECEISAYKPTMAVFAKICWHNNALGFAHGKKRKKLTKEELKKVILGCTPCHTIIEYECLKKTGMTMEQFIDAVIAARKVKV